MTDRTLFEKMRQFPKVDLHRHLEGSIRVETFIDIAKKENVFLPTYDLEEFRRLIQVTDEPPDFISFLNKFKIVRGFYPSQKAIERVTYEVIEDAALDSIQYLELRYSPTHFACGKGFPEEEVIRWIQGAIDRAVDAYDIEVVPVVTISRNYGIELAENTVKIAAKYAGRFFFGFDFAGDEINFPATSMAHLFRMAKDAGLGLTIHAGEAGGPENVIEAVEEFDSDRIGHGIQAARSEAAMALLKEKKVMLEICPTSNLHTGVVDSLENHPVKTFYKRDIPVSLNTDDPMISNITLTDEYTNALEKMGFDENDLKRFNLMALDHSFHPDKKSLKERLSHLWH